MLSLNAEVDLYREYVQSRALQVWNAKARVFGLVGIYNVPEPRAFRCYCGGPVAKCGGKGERAHGCFLTTVESTLL